MLLRPQAKVPHHLHGLCILHLQMTLLNHTLHKMLVNQLAKGPPQRPILHSKQMTAAGDCMGNK